MTTKMKEGIPSTKEKRGTSPSHPPNKDTIQGGKSPRPTISKQAPPSNRSNSASPSGRNVPNYLKGTASSGPESSLPQKPTISISSRRKSLDKPLPPSHIPKTRVSTITRDTKKQPSSPSSARATSSHASSAAKPLSGRLSKARSFGEEKVSSRNNHVKKVEIEAQRQAARTDAIITEIVDIAPKKENDPQIESLLENKEDLDHASSFITQTNNEDIKKEVIVVLEDNDSNNIDINSEIEVEEEVKIYESSKNESIEDIEEENIKEKEIEKEVEQEISNMEEIISSPNEVEELKEVEEVKTNEVEELKEKEEEDVVEILKATETSVKKDEGKKEKEGGDQVKQQQVLHGKRESVVSNDAIEETASKLREKRVNRVKALAGAFESVMS